jgi:anti-anti-sigma factor
VGSLEVTQSVQDSAVVLVVGGEVDSGSVTSLVPHLDAGLGAAGDHPTKMLVVELARVTHFGSAGLNAVLECYEQGTSTGIAVRVVAPNPEVLRPIEVTGLDKVLRPFETVHEAVTANEEPR